MEKGPSPNGSSKGRWGFNRVPRGYAARRCTSWIIFASSTFRSLTLNSTHLPGRAARQHGSTAWWLKSAQQCEKKLTSIFRNWPSRRKCKKISWNGTSHHPEFLYESKIHKSSTLPAVTCKIHKNSMLQNWRSVAMFFANLESRGLTIWSTRIKLKVKIGEQHVLNMWEACAKDLKKLSLHSRGSKTIPLLWFSKNRAAVPEFWRMAVLVNRSHRFFGACQLGLWEVEPRVIVII